MPKSNRTDEVIASSEGQDPAQATGDPQVTPVGDLDVELSVTSPPTPVQGPADGVTPVDPTRPVGNWGVYPQEGEQ